MTIGRERTAERDGTKRRAVKAVRADWRTPEPQGLFDPRDEKDACGVGFIADIKGRKSHQIVEDALAILLNLEHRARSAPIRARATARAFSYKSRISFS